eukprot:TRINITY_DN7781_c0_g1_i14.p2 TRINITY_DN7781_c0_g1~~TRINITY_DN7781_c0_g1_i14.p2  ORF type:complete len:102 (+),score=27.36 TRINITY_DN7781_c0_g1_i14:24-308(+)
MIRRPPRSTHCISSAASDVYKRQVHGVGDYINVSSGKLFCNSPDQVKFLIIGLMPIPCGFLIRAIPTAQGRLIAMLTLGLSFQYFFYSLCSFPH